HAYAQAPMISMQPVRQVSMTNVNGPTVTPTVVMSPVPVQPVQQIVQVYCTPCTAVFSLQLVYGQNVRSASQNQQTSKNFAKKSERHPNICFVPILWTLMPVYTYLHTHRYTSIDSLTHTHAHSLTSTHTHRWFP
ncbi:MAG: hypothetical protein ACPIOQ_81315, partial [Promethearchaeia archaeon]